MSKLQSGLRCADGVPGVRGFVAAAAAARAVNPVAPQRKAAWGGVRPPEPRPARPSPGFVNDQLANAGSIVAAGAVAGVP